MLVLGPGVTSQDVSRDDLDDERASAPPIGILDAPATPPAAPADLVADRVDRLHRRATRPATPVGIKVDGLRATAGDHADARRRRSWSGPSPGDLYLVAQSARRRDAGDERAYAYRVPEG